MRRPKIHRPRPDAADWTRSTCPYCGRRYPHKKNYKPSTCGRSECLHIMQISNRFGPGHRSTLY